jgi:drug/metabolite transporter (DMT)-like permease
VAALAQSGARRGDPHTWRLIGAYSAVYLIWGSTYLGIRFAIETIPPLLMIGFRNFLAGALLYGWMRFRGAPAPGRAQWKAALVTGLLLFLADHGALAWGEQRVPSGLAALLCATLPFSMVMIARLMGHEKYLPARVLIGLIAGLAGVALLVGPDALFHQGSTDLLGCGVILLGVTSWAAGSMFGRGAPLPASPALSAGMQMMLGGAALLCAGLLFGEAGRLHLAAISARSLLSLAYLISFGSIVAFTAFLWLLRVSTPSRLATYAYVNPVVALLLGWALAGEAIGPRTWLATAVILAGVALVNSAKPRAAAQAPTVVREPLRCPAPVPQASSQHD